MEKKNIFVVGIDEYNRGKLEGIENADGYRFHGLLELPEVKREDLPLAELLDQAMADLHGFEGSIDAIIGFYDFPVALMAPYLGTQFDLPGPTMESVIRAEHKYFSRQSCTRAAPRHNPPFDLVQPSDPKPVEVLGLDFPFWIKPVVAFGSQLGFEVGDEDDYRKAIEAMHEEIGRFSRPYNEFLNRICHDQEICTIGGDWCIAEGIIGGWQCTLSGFVHDGEIHAYGVVDSVNYPGSSSFQRYEYPSRLPAEVQDRMAEIAQATVREMGFDQWPFNMEFYYEEDTDRIWMLEMNTRISQSHASLYEQVDGVSNHQVLVEAALGQAPRMPRNEGPYRVAAMFHPRVFEDRFVKRSPSDEDLERLRKEYPDVEFLPEARQGQRLSELPNQDSYSYRLARVYLAADSREELEEKFEQVMEMAGYEFED